MYQQNRAENAPIPHDILTRTIGNCADAGVKIPEGILSAMLHAAERIQRINTMRANLDAAGIVERTARLLAAGEGTEEDVLAAANAKLTTATTASIAGPTGPVADVLRRAQTLITAEENDAIKPHGEALVKAMRPIIEKLADAIVTAFPNTLDIDPRNLRELDWILREATLREHWDTLQQLYGAARQLRRHGLIPSTNRRDDWYEFAGADVTLHTRKAGDVYTYGLRDRLQAGNVTSLVWAHRNGLKPTLLLEAETDQPHDQSIETYNAA